MSSLPLHTQTPNLYFSLGLCPEFQAGAPNQRLPVFTAKLISKCLIPVFSSLRSRPYLSFLVASYRTSLQGRPFLGSERLNFVSKPEPTQTEISLTITLHWEASIPLCILRSWPLTSQSPTHCQEVFCVHHHQSGPSLSLPSTTPTNSTASILIPLLTFTSS